MPNVIRACCNIAGSYDCNEKIVGVPYSETEEQIEV